MNITNANWNGMDNGTWAWTLTGTTRTALFTSPCLNINPNHSHNFNTHLRVSHNISHTLASSQIPAPKRSSQKTSTLPLLNKMGKTYIQEVIGTFLYCARCVDSTMLPGLGSLALQQSNLTENSKTLVHQFLDYAAMHPNAIITYKASNMVLTGHSNASYLSETNTHNHTGGHFFMSNNDPIPANNGVIIPTSQIIKAVMSSAAEAEIGVLYINCREAIPS
jgi:hypothetical protein